MNQEDIQKAFDMLSRHNDALLLENEELKRRLMRGSLWYAIKRAFLIWRGRDV